jgi:hypothetical protein
VGPQTATRPDHYRNDRHDQPPHAESFTAGSDPNGLVYTPAGAVLPRHTTPAPTTLMRASTVPGQTIAFAPTHAPSSTVIGWQKNRKRGSFQS